MREESIQYSLDPKVTLSQIQEGNFVYDANKYTKLKDRIEEHKVGAIQDSDSDIHYKFLSIRPRIHHCYYMGDISLLNQKILGIVGPRLMSNYGKQVLESLFALAPDYDFVTISGMAEGIDQLCHKLSRDYHIPTIAILGGGLGYYMKRSERAIIEQIVADGGLVISEYKLGERPTYYTFPQRNRLIAGLSDILFLPEAGEKSGSLITVDFALTMKKPVYAAPNSIFSPTSIGILHYIETGQVKSISHLQTFLSTHFTSKTISSRPKPTIQLTDQEQGLLSLFSRDQGIDITSLFQTTGGNIQEIIQLLTILEIKGVIAQEGVGKYVLV